ncbi:putative Transmembrane adaptor Erv26 [Paratrimastix pyriformis]|uniref:Transmembrane adaptor Erv26 n=1 Tax=Paratrimastix pyriformis TaxID=342808 RepID=A0ABQ8UIC1_9EUKA|nr:putative Transmembrane adaptor Erv26 [Paratrimastix pyriformis]
MSAWAVMYYSASLIFVVFVSFCAMSALYFLSDQAEEHSVLAKKTIKYTDLAIILAHVLLLIFDGFSLFPIIVGLITHMFYYLLVVNRFPLVSIKEPLFLISGVMMVVDNVVWFRFYFENQTGGTNVIMGFSFFFCFLLLVPILLALSLSINDYALPLGSGMGGLSAFDEDSMPTSKQSSSGGTWRLSTLLRGVRLQVERVLYRLSGRTVMRA